MEEPRTMLKRQAGGRTRLSTSLFSSSTSFLFIFLPLCASVLTKSISMLSSFSWMQQAYCCMDGMAELGTKSNFIFISEVKVVAYTETNVMHLFRKMGIIRSLMAVTVTGPTVEFRCHGTVTRKRSSSTRRQRVLVGQGLPTFQGYSHRPRDYRHRT